MSTSEEVKAGPSNGGREKERHKVNVKGLTVEDFVCHVL